MAKHTERIPEPQPVTHILELTDDEAYQVWLLSVKFEGGPCFPGSIAIQDERVHQFFNRSTRDRFAGERDAGRKLPNASDPSRDTWYR